MSPEMYLHMLEFFKLKDEQIKRMEYRDTMVHVHIVVVGSVFAFAMHEKLYIALLLIPWLCVVIGWAYLLNDDRISAIGEYVREDLKQELSKLLPQPATPIFGWEVHHRSDTQRQFRRYLQFFIDQLTFVFSGVFALTIFYFFDPGLDSVRVLTGFPLRALYAITLFETLLLIGLSLLFWFLADFRKQKPVRRIA